MVEISSTSRLAQEPKPSPYIHISRDHYIAKPPKADEDMSVEPIGVLAVNGPNAEVTLGGAVGRLGSRELDISAPHLNRILLPAAGPQQISTMLLGGPPAGFHRAPHRQPAGIVCAIATDAPIK
jgi:hypothetical protein